MKTVRLELKKIILNPEIQPRVELDNSHIEDLKTDLMEGAVFPPVVVFYDGSNYRLAEGFHRYFAYHRAGLSEIVAEIREGGERDAQLYGVGSNATHGKRRTNADKRRAVATLLKDEEWGTWSDRQIAKKCLVSQPLVSDVRKELTESGFQFPTTRKCSDGREMDVSQIGSNRDQESPQAEASAGETSNEVQDEAGTTEAQANPGVPSLENTETQPTQNGSTEVETGVEDRESTDSGVGGTTQGVRPATAKVPAAEEAQNGSGEAIVPPESDSTPDGPAPAEVSPQQSGGVNQVQEGGETQPDEQKYPNDPAKLKRLLDQEKAEKVKLQGELDARDQLVKDLLDENRKLKEEVEYLREQLTEDTTV